MCGHNERLWQTLDIGNMLRPTFGFKYSHEFQFKELNYGSFLAVLLISIFLHGKIYIALYFLRSRAESLKSDRLWAPHL